MDWIIENKSWLFNGIGVTFLILLFNFLRSRNKRKNKNEEKNNLLIEGFESINHNNDDFSFAKDHIRILFIDDDTKFKIIKILNKAGWKTKIVKDIDNLDSDLILNNHIFFVDINGVGIKLGFKDEGLGLASAIKKKYPEKKVIIYSSEQVGNRFHKALRTVDDFLPKNAEPFEFQQVIENFSSEIEL